MAISANTVSVTGSTANFDVQASGSGFGIFSSYSTYASEAFTYTGSTAAGTGSFALSLDTSFGDLVFSGTDTIGATASSYSFVASETLSFVIGSDTLNFGNASVTGGSTLGSMSADLNNFYSSITTINSVVSLSDTVAAAAAADVASNISIVVSAITPTVAGAAASVTQHGVQFNFTKLS